jgi:hypothetical protein
MACHQARRENCGAHVEYRTCIQQHGGHNNRDLRSLNPEGLGPKAFGSNVRNASFPKSFWAPKNIIKYDDKPVPASARGLPPHVKGRWGR